jgi:serine/threonine protein kinase
MIGKTVGHYSVLEELGRGGMGEVYLAEDTRLERKVALKFLPYFASQDETEKARFIQEAKAAARLSHANIAQVHEIGEEEGRLYIVMEYVSGGSLRDVLDEAKGRPLPLEKVLAWAQQTAEGLAEAHNHRIVHRDIKPDNLMLNQKGQIKITDFGLARLETTTRLTVSGAQLGTVNYMSPEQVLGKAVDHRADLFSLGTTLYELLTGHRAFEGSDANSTYYAILNETVDPLDRYCRDLPAGIESLVVKLLEKDPTLRIQSADDVASEVRRIQRPKEVPHTPAYRKLSIRERIRRIPKHAWTVLSLLLIALSLQAIPSVASYRRLVREVIYRDFAAKVHDSSGMRPRMGAYSVIELPFERWIVSNEIFFAKIQGLKQAGGLDAQIASALLTYAQALRASWGGVSQGTLVEAADRDLTSAIERFRIPYLYSLRSTMRFIFVSWRSSYPLPVDSLAEWSAQEAMRLEPQNGFHALLAAIGLIHREDFEAAEELLGRAAHAEEFRVYWSEYFAALERAMQTINAYNPRWQVLIDDVAYYFYREVSRELSYFLYWHSRESRSLGRPESPEINRRRSDLVEILGYRIWLDPTGNEYRFRTGYDLVSNAVARATNASTYSESELELKRMQTASLASIMPHLYRGLYAEIDSGEDQSYDSGVFMFSLLFMSLYMSAITVLCLLTYRYEQGTGRLSSKSPLGRYYCEVRYLMAWAVLSVPALLIVPIPIGRADTIVTIISLLAMQLALIGLIYPVTVNHPLAGHEPERKEGIISYFLRHQRKVGTYALVLTIACLTLILTTALAEEPVDFFRRELSTLSYYWPLIFPLVSLPIVLRASVRSNPEDVMQSFFRKELLLFASTALAASIFLAIESTSRIVT